MFTSAFWKAATERAVKTFAQALIAFFGADVVFNVVEADWGEALSIGGGATVLSLLMSLLSAGVGNAGPSLANEVLTTGRGHTDVTDARLR